MSVELGPLAGHELVVFDKDGTLIDFHTMWGGWSGRLADNLEAATGTTIRPALFEAFGIDPTTGGVRPHGLLNATPMAVLRGVASDALVSTGLSRPAAECALRDAWVAPDPVELARPLADLAALFGAIRATGGSIAVATSDDREPTVRTLVALRIAHLVDGIACADDGLPVKPAGDMVIRLCATLGVDVANAAVVGDTVEDLRMGRSAGVRTCLGVLSGTATAEELRPFADALVASVADLGRPV